MSHPLVVHYRYQSYDMYVGRPSKWGNPFRVGPNQTHADVIAKYRDWICSQPQLIEDAKRELRGKVLGCWCAPRPCHADVLAEIANPPLG